MTDTSSRPLPENAGSDDHALAAWLATVAGDLLLQVRQEGLEGKALKDAGDQAAHELLMRLLAEHRPDDAVLSEEGKDDKRRLTSRRVWIVDPLDGTREFSEPPRDDWAVHVALWEDGDLVAGAVAQPGLDTTFSTGSPAAVPERTSPAVADRGVPDPTAGLRRGARPGDRRRAGSHGVCRRQGHLRGPRRHRRLRARRRPVRVGLRRTGRGRPRGRPPHQQRRRCAAGLQPGRRAAAGPPRLPAGAGRDDHRVRPSLLVGEPAPADLPGSSRSSRSAHSSSGAMSKTASSMPSCRSPSSANRGRHRRDREVAGLHARRPRPSASGVETVPSGLPRTE